MTRLARDIFIGFGDDAAPGFDMFISGLNAGKSAEFFNAIRPLIASVMFEDDIVMSSKVELVLINQPDTAPGKPVDWRAVIDAKAFQEGNYIDLFMGYGSQRTYMDRGEIVKWLPVFPETGPGTVTIIAYDGRHRMQQANKVKSRIKKKRKTAYKNTPDNLIVARIAAKYGFGVDADPVEVDKKRVVVISGKKQQVRYVIPTRIQTSGQTDWKFMQRLAAINDFDLWVDFKRDNPQAGANSGGKFFVHFKKRDNPVIAEFAFTYNTEDGSLLSAEPHFTIKDQPTSVDILLYDKKTRKIERTTISESRPTENVNLAGARVGPGQLKATKSIVSGARVRFTAYGQTITAIADKPFRSKKDAKQFVEKFLRAHERDFLTLEGKVVGIPTLRARQVHQIKGLGARLDGFYRFTNVKHHMKPDAIYHCEFVGYKIISQTIATRTPRRAVCGVLIKKTNRGVQFGARDPLQPPQRRDKCGPRVRKKP